MNKMKSLLWREYMLGRKKTLFGLISFVMVTALCWLALISVKHGNLAAAFKNLDEEMPGMAQGLSALVYGAAMYVPVMMSLVLTSENGAVSADLKSGWKLFSQTLPVTPAESLGVKYILKVISTAAVFLINLGNFAAASALADRKLEVVHINVLLLFINITLLSEFVKCAVLYRAKTEKETILAEFASFAVFVILGIPYFRRLNRRAGGFTAENEFQDFFKMIGIIADDMKKIFPFMIPVMIALLAGGYFVHLIIVRRADK